MGSALDIHRLHFAFTVTFHYLFPQLTMGLALLIVILKTMALRTGDEHYNRAARFWAKIFGINFAIGVVTGIPMEFQFGTNWAEFSKSAGGVIGQTLAMEGFFPFFLESTSSACFSSAKNGSAVSVIGSLRSSFSSARGFPATSSWPPTHGCSIPTGYRLLPNNEIALASFWGLLLNPWALAQYAHNMLGAVQTGCFVMAAVGAFYVLSNRELFYGKTFLRIGVIVGVIAAVLQLFPTGDIQGKLIAQPSTRHARRHGRPVRPPEWRAARHPRPTRCSKTQA